MVIDNYDEAKEALKRESKVVANRAREFERSSKVGQSAADLGLCSTCEHLQFTETQYGRRYAACAETGVKLYGRDPVKYCTMYWKVGGLTIREFKEMAILIDSKGHRKAGFIYDEDDEMLDFYDH